MDDDFSATIIFDSPFGLITTTSKKLFEFNSQAGKLEKQVKRKKTVTWADENGLCQLEVNKKNPKYEEEKTVTPKAPPTPVRSKKVESIPPIVSHFITNKKNNRTKVFSGCTIKDYHAQPLVDLCMHVIDSNREELLGYDKLPDSLVTFALRKATVTQLLNIESKNPTVIGKTEDLWCCHYKRDFKHNSDQKPSSKSWRNIYLDAMNLQKRELRIIKKNAQKHSSQHMPAIVLPENKGVVDTFSQALDGTAISLKRKREPVTRGGKKFQC